MKMLIREGGRIGSTPWFAWTMAMLLSLSRPGLAADENQPHLPNRSEVAAENQIAAAIPRLSPKSGSAPATGSPTCFALTPNGRLSSSTSPESSCMWGS